MVQIKERPLWDGVDQAVLEGGNPLRSKTARRREKTWRGA
jgi:hypothetical protein